MGWMLSFPNVMMPDFVFFCETWKAFVRTEKKQPSSIAEWMREKIRMRWKKKNFAGIFHTFYVQLMHDGWVWVLFMLLSLVGHGEEWMKNGQMWDTY